MSQRSTDLPPSLRLMPGSTFPDRNEAGEISSLQAMVDILRKPNEVNCPHCWGRGSAYGGACCTYCYGSGKLQSPET